MAQLHSGNAVTNEDNAMYQSPYSQRYASSEMRALWTEAAKRKAWRRVWFAVAQAQSAAGLVTAEQLEDIEKHTSNIDLERAYEIESEIHHDLMAELRTFSEQCPIGGAILHWGLTSADVQDNADVLRQRAALTLTLRALRKLLLAFADRIEEMADLPVMGYTHLQPAEPTTLGYRFSLYAQDLLMHFESIAELRVNLWAKGIKGAVGTYAPFQDMLAGTGMSPEALEAKVMEILDLQSYELTGQTYPRIQDYWLVSRFSGLAATLHKFGIDLRILQSPGFLTAAEPFKEAQVGSSAMPFKRNPVHSEKICSLARQVASGVFVAWENAANQLLERTLDDSANRRRLLPETFMAMDEMLITTTDIVEGLKVNQRGIRNAMETYGPFSALERILTALVRSGANRQEMHELLRNHSSRAYEALRKGGANPLLNQLQRDERVLQYLQPRTIHRLMQADRYTGKAADRARQMVTRIRERFAASQELGEG